MWQRHGTRHTMRSRACTHMLEAWLPRRRRVPVWQLLRVPSRKRLLGRIRQGLAFRSAVEHRRPRKRLTKSARPAETAWFALLRGVRHELRGCPSAVWSGPTRNHRSQISFDPQAPYPRSRRVLSQAASGGDRPRIKRTPPNVCERLWNSGPARTRTEDQGIHSTPPFPARVDYLFTPVGCGTLVPVIKRN